MKTDIKPDKKTEKKPVTKETKPDTKPEETPTSRSRMRREAQARQHDGQRRPDDKAKTRYQEIIKSFPNTKAAKEAKDRLEKLK